MSLKYFSKKVGIGAVLAMAITAPAFADLPPEAATGATTLQTDALALQALFWPVLIAVCVGFVVMKHFKRGANKV